MVLLRLFLFLSLIQSSPNERKEDTAFRKDKHIEVSAALSIYEIFDINLVDETYKVEGYIHYSWQDESVKFQPNDSMPKSIIYENERATIALEKNELWIPAFEFLNVHGKTEILNRKITKLPNGEIQYEEHFLGTFSANMNFSKFPFDSQRYIMEIEAYSYNSEQLIFKNPKMFLEDEQDEFPGEGWEFISKDVRVTTKNYKYLADDADYEKNSYSRLIFEVQAKRLSGYYIWQVLFPLIIIIMASFAIFWIKEFGTQIRVGSTLMLAVVAFNFYSASILPKLPYNTFIEYVIIVGFIFILLGIIAVIINHRINWDEKKKDKNTLLKYFSYGFPLAYTLVMILLYMKIIM